MLQHAHLKTVTWGRLSRVRKFAMRKGIEGDGARWFRGFDRAKTNIKYRHARMMLCDFVLILQHASPYGLVVDPNDTLDTIFEKCGQSMAVACYILRDERLFQVSAIT